MRIIDGLYDEALGYQPLLQHSSGAFAKAAAVTLPNLGCLDVLYILMGFYFSFKLALRLGLVVSPLLRKITGLFWPIWDIFFTLNLYIDLVRVVINRQQWMG